MDKFNYLKEQITAALATWQQTNGGKITVGWMHAANPEVISALLAELEAKDKRISELSVGKVGNALLERENHHVEVVDKLLERIAELAEREKRVVALANGNDELWDAMAHRLKTLEAKLATPVRLPGMMFIKVSGSAVPVMHGERVKERIRAAGFKCVGDE